MKINKKVLILAVLFGLITVILLNIYISGLSSKEENIISYTQVAVAVNKIPAHVIINADMVKLKSVPSEAVHAEAITSLDKLIGGVSKTDIVKDEQILSSRVVKDAKYATLAYRVPLNMRAIAIPSSEITGVAGYINIGDKIDILVTYSIKEINPVTTTYTQLQNIEVIAVGSAKLTADEKNTTIPSSITVLANPAQAEEIAYAILNGKLHYTLRNPLDKKKVNLDFFNSTNFSTFKVR